MIPGAKVDTVSAGTRTPGPGKVDGAYCTLDQLMALRGIASRLQATPGQRMARGGSGQHHSRIKGRGIEFSEVRVYQPGDDIRSIDWRLSARSQRIYTKMFQEERERPVFIICDQSRSQFFGSQRFKSVLAAETAALVSWMMLARGDRVGGMVFSGSDCREVRPARQQRRVAGFLEQIVRFNHQLSAAATPDTGQTLNSILKRIGRTLRPGTLTILITDFSQFDAASARFLRLIARHGELAGILTYDPLEACLPAPGYYPITDGIQTTLLDTGNRKLAEAYQQHFQQRLQLLQRHFRELSAPLLHLHTGEQPADLFSSHPVSSHPVAGQNGPDHLAAHNQPRVGPGLERSAGQ